MRTHNYIMAGLLAFVATCALFAALFLGATHQLLMASIGYGVSAALWYENKKLKRHA